MNRSETERRVLVGLGTVAGVAILTAGLLTGVPAAAQEVARFSNVLITGTSGALVFSGAGAQLSAPAGLSLASTNLTGVGNITATSLAAVGNVSGTNGNFVGAVTAGTSMTASTDITATGTVTGLTAVNSPSGVFTAMNATGIGVGSAAFGTQATPIVNGNNTVSASGVTVLIVSNGLTSNQAGGIQTITGGSEGKIVYLVSGSIAYTWEIRTGGNIAANAAIPMGTNGGATLMYAGGRWVVVGRYD